MSRNIRLYPWFQFFRNLVFWQAVWFLFFQKELSASEAITLYAIYDIGTTVIEVPSGYLSDRFGRRITLILSALMGVAGASLLAFGSDFYIFALAQVLMGASGAFASGTDSALLYESLSREGRSNEIASFEINAWRYSFSALALSALAGGFLAAIEPTLPFQATAVAAIIVVLIAFCFREPEPSKERGLTFAVRQQVRAIGGALFNPVLAWFFVLTVGMYVFSHVPYVFGQPFILETLDRIGFANEAAVVSGSVSAAMMVVSVGTSWLAHPLYRLLGLGSLLLVALSLQVGLIGVLAATVHPFAIGLLLLRMVPDALARPFVLARVQPLLDSQYRATYWSLKSLAGRVILASTLLAVSSATATDGPLSHAALQGVLLWYIPAGLVLLVVLAMTIKLPNRNI
jgi:MFS family permease